MAGADIPVSGPSRSTQILPDVSSPEREDSRVFVSPLWLAALVAGAALLRLWGLARKSLWMDEGVSYAIATARDRSFDSYWAYQALYHELLRLWLRLGDSEFCLRLFSVIPSVATVPVVYLLGKRLANRRVGLLSALLLTVHVAHITYSQQARGYGLVVLLCSLATYFFVRAVEKEDEDGAAWHWVLYVLFSGLAIYSHFLAVLVVPAQVLSLAALPSRGIPWRRLLPSLAAIAVLPLPLVWLITHGGTEGTSFITASYRQWPGLITLLGGSVATLPLYAAFWTVAVRSLRQTLAGGGRSWPAWRLTLLVSWTLAPAVLLSLLSLVKPAFVPRYLLVSVPGAVLLAGAGLDRWQPRTRAVLTWATVVLSLAAVVFYSTRPKEDWRGATNYIVAQWRPGDAVVILPPYAGLPFQYYRRRAGADALPIANLENAANGAAGATHYQRLWVAVYLHHQFEPEVVSCLAGVARGFHQESSRSFTGIDVQLYSSAGSKP